MGEIPRKGIIDQIPPYLPDAFESLGPLMLTSANYPPEEAKKALIGLSRDLRGLVSVFNTQASYLMFFDWM